MNNLRWIEDDPRPVEEAKPLSIKERLAKQRQENHLASEENWKQIQARQQNSEYDVSPAGQRVNDRLKLSMDEQCSLEDEMKKNHQHVLISDLEDAHKILHNIWIDKGRDTAALASSINTAKSWFNHTEPMFDAHSIAKQFGDLGVKADLVESKGRTFIAFSGSKNGTSLKHAIVNGTRIKLDGKKYPLNSFKVSQAGFSPKARASNFRGAAALTFIVSASIATTDLIFKDNYHLVDWFGHVGSDMFKALVQFGAGEAVLFALAGAGTPIFFGALACVAAYVAIEWLWGEYKISNSIVKRLENAIQD